MPEGLTNPEEMKIALAQSIVSKLEHFLKEGEDIPEYEVDFGDFKVRKNWWHGVTQELETAESESVLSGEVEAKVQDFLHFIFSPNFKNRWTTEEDIKKADQIINDVVEYLKREYSL